MISITILQDKIIEGVSKKTYYIGEKNKRKDIDYSVIQTSSDTKDELSVYAETGVNNIVGSLVKRVNDIGYTNEQGNIVITFTPFDRIPDNVEVVAKLLAKAIEDYLVSFTTAQWLNTIAPELAGPIFNQLDYYMAQVYKYIGMFSGMVVRRATDLAGI